MPGGRKGDAGHQEDGKSGADGHGKDYKETAETVRSENVEIMVESLLAAMELSLIHI